MSKDPTELAAVTEYLRRLGNPYAKLQIYDDAESDLRPLTDVEHAYKQRLGNPYASLSIGIKDHAEASKLGATPRSDTRDGQMSMAQFDSECRRIFQQYSPGLERGRLRDPHRAFMSRNRHRSSKVRHQLVARLRKYDLSGIAGGIQPHFNRERDDLTDAKLKEIERAVLGGDS